MLSDTEALALATTYADAGADTGAGATEAEVLGALAAWIVARWPVAGDDDGPQAPAD